MDAHRPTERKPLPSDWRDVLGLRVRVYDGAEIGVRAEGKVIGVITAPTLVIVGEDGTRYYESSDLPLDWCEERWVRT